jgi:hypothetical protein
MAHYAFLDENNIVTQVIAGNDGDEWEQFYSQEVGQVCKRTSYNTYGGKHKIGGEPFRKNYAGIGFTYNADKDAFIAPKPFETWLLDEETCLWESPVAYPDDGKIYIWDDEQVNWIER